MFVFSACYSSVEDQAETPTPKPDETEHEAKKGTVIPHSLRDILMKRQLYHALCAFGVYNGVRCYRYLPGSGMHGPPTA